MAIHALLASDLVESQDELSLEGINRRAEYIGPVLENILREMKDHGRDNLDWER